MIQEVQDMPFAVKGQILSLEATEQPLTTNP